MELSSVLNDGNSKPRQAQEYGRSTLSRASDLAKPEDLAMSACRVTGPVGLATQTQGADSLLECRGQGFRPGLLGSSSAVPAQTILNTVPARSGKPPAVLNDIITKDFSRDVFFSEYQARLGGSPGHSRSAARIGLDQLLNFITNDPAIVDLRWAAYLLATVRAECGGAYLPVEKDHAQITKNLARRDLRPGLVETSSGTPIKALSGDRTTEQAYVGRGYVPLTRKEHYAEIGALIGKDLVGNPRLALEPATAYRIMSVCLTTGKGLAKGRKLGEFISGGKCDYESAGRSLHGTAGSIEIAQYARAFEAMLRTSLRDRPSSAKSALVIVSSEKAARAPEAPNQPKIETLHWVAFSLAAKPDDASRPSWWAARKEPRYCGENFTSTLTNGEPSGKLDDGGAVRFESLPPGSCSMRFTSIYADIESLFKSINSQTFK